MHHSGAAEQPFMDGCAMRHSGTAEQPLMDGCRRIIKKKRLHLSEQAPSM